MSPDPWLRYQAAALAVLLLATIVLGGAIFALSLGGAAAFSALALWLKYVRDLDRVDRSAPPHRERLDILVTGDARAALLPPLVLACFVVVFSPRVVAVGDFVLVAAACVATVAAAVYASSLFDWFVILPRISGVLGARPCKTKGEPAGWPDTWRKLTRWWYIHRIAAAFVLVYGLALAMGIVAAGTTDTSSVWVELAFTSVLGSFGAYRKAIFAAIKEAGHPHLIGGRAYTSALSGRKYVFDVLVEGSASSLSRGTSSALPSPRPSRSSSRSTLTKSHTPRPKSSITPIPTYFVRRGVWGSVGMHTEPPLFRGEVSATALPGQRPVIPGCLL